MTSDLCGFCIPGLAMAAGEFELPEGVMPLENPEIGAGAVLGRSYALEEVAEIHARTINRMVGRTATQSFPLVLVGMSMGGMILAIVATEFRGLLPRKCLFRFLVTTPNRPENPAIPDALVTSWATARPGEVDDFARILSPFFSPAFREFRPAEARAYYEYRARGESGQSPRAFYRQMNALRACPAYGYFARLDPETAQFVGGAEDAILGPTHNRDLGELCPGALHTEVAGLGHMLNIERPDLLRRAFAL